MALKVICGGVVKNLHPTIPAFVDDVVDFSIKEGLLVAVCGEWKAYLQNEKISLNKAFRDYSTPCL